ncbi:MAG: cyclopropane-fatty-acyl-phospholipid synthase family protein [Xanthobacteraceae bacterium]|nr:cyclopropane-fatty-acyl-phospholipid synthase family protein [Xanthobacteraceae bacterium]
MSIQHQQSTPLASEGRRPSHSLVAALLRGIGSRVKHGRLVIESPAGERFVAEGSLPGPHAHLKVYRWNLLWRILLRGDIGFAESYIAGECSTPNLGVLMRFALRNADALRPARWLRASGVFDKLRHALNRNTRRGSRRNIAAHYDLGNEFYAQWLDPSMSYSSALFTEAGQTLEDAQEAKLRRVFDLLDLSGGERVLEIGCGWGGLAQRLIERHACHVTGITLSTRQLEFARKGLHDRGLSARCDLRLQDYREVRGAYDRIVSIEMLEAVGASYWPTYFRQLRDNLRPGGIAVLQVITIAEARFESYRRRPDFIQQCIFPGGMLPTAAIIGRETAAAGLQLVATEFFGESYAQTLLHWQRRFQDAWSAIEQLGFDRRFKRTWEYYLEYCKAGFEAEVLNVGLYTICNRSAPAAPG